MAESLDPSLNDRLGPAGTEVVDLAVGAAAALDTAEVRSPHVLRALLNQRSGLAAEALGMLGIDTSDVGRLLPYPPPGGPFPEPLSEGAVPSLGPEVLDVLEWAIEEANIDDRPAEVDGGDILIALARAESDTAAHFRNRDAPPERIRELIGQLRAEREGRGACEPNRPLHSTTDWQTSPRSPPPRPQQPRSSGEASMRLRSNRLR